MGNSYKLLQASEILLYFHNLLMKDVHTSQQSFPFPGEQGPAVSIPLPASSVPSNQEHSDKNVTYLTNPQGDAGCCQCFCVFSSQAIKHTLAVPHSFSPKTSQPFLINKTNQNLKQSLSFSQIPQFLTFSHDFSSSFSSLCSLDSNPLPENMKK